MNLQFLRRTLLVFIFLFVVSLKSIGQEADVEYIDNYYTWNLDEYESTTGAIINAFSQSPTLDELVESGELPPLEERLPEREDILVVQPRQEIGIYGDRLTYYGMNPDSFGNTGTSAWDQHFMAPSTDMQVLFPQIAKSVELSEDLMTITVTLRRGMRWSDGASFTTADIEFWYEDIALNDELPGIPSDLSPSGVPAVIGIVDEYTATFTFSEPYPVILPRFATSSQIFPMAPRHYLEQFHIDYNENVAQLADEAGFDTWAGYFANMSAGQTGDGQFNPDLPVLKPWTLESVDTFGNKFYRRNPYYYKVDTEGQQLPYVDNQTRLLLSEPEVIMLNIQAGEIDYTSVGFGFDVRDLPVLRAGEAEGDYTTLLWSARTGANWKFMFNITTQDEVLREVFNDLRWRQAMSSAINRHEINDVLYFGLGAERQWGPPEGDRFFEEWMYSYYADYDIELANQLLDEMGLEWDSNGEYRLRPDGERLSIVLWNAISQDALVELVAEYWETVGIDVEINPTTREAFAQALIANEVHASIWFGNWDDEFQMYLIPIWFRPPYGIDSTPVGGGLDWWLWFNSDGEEGTEPPEWQLDQMELVQAFQRSVFGSQEYIDLGQQVASRMAERLYNIGTVGQAPVVAVRSNQLENFPDELSYFNHLISGHSDQWFMKP